MARTIADIKKEMTGYFIANETVIGLYGLDTSKSFEDQFSKVSLESIFFYVVSAAIWTLEVLFDTHKAEISALIDASKPHRLKWYIDKTLAFQFGRALVAESDVYDNTDITDEQITAERVVKYAAAIEQAGHIVIKVAGEGNDGREPLTEDQEAALTAYLKEIKDAGVRIDLVNEAANAFRATIDIYYDPMILNASLASLADGGTPVKDAVVDFIANLPFNGEYRNAALVDRLQSIPGVVIPELHVSSIDDTQVLAKATPISGYMKVYNENDLVLNAIPYATISN
ncbi:MAG: hypothetical protein A2W90_18040 [Bacteroidetes bacterium GWF2_42_66]|nr:MAG: hypothetical protein A2W92_22300 [Bacteroidetes bacterium GWA2_42_15]OFX98153.1 MAG: hypothetical protein A2W89_09530 [Bacteroidetes bacterium GWE2_42_39]OFY42538.1 MAG: hypothetical protein A2W90_18040 [Bacteroidetes bacterium GWF2_42_66]HBL74254.1 hypothetical protein [Prolixibacteraceae bacterium]HCU64023.1 hypothetical protein [Prolixibacteraceae bacterium]